MLDFIYLKLDKKEYSSGLFVGLCKASDTTLNGMKQLTLPKLQDDGIRGSNLQFYYILP